MMVWFEAQPGLCLEVCGQILTMPLIKEHLAESPLDGSLKKVLEGPLEAACMCRRCVRERRHVQAATRRLLRSICGCEAVEGSIDCRGVELLLLSLDIDALGLNP
jgi:hypothetical protein